jgi:outer membrane protein
MKQLSLILSIVAILLAGTVLYLQLSSSKQHPQSLTAADKSALRKESNFTIAYFDIDSMQNNYQYFKDALGTLKAREEIMNEELRAMERSKQKKIDEWRQKSTSNISQAEAEAMNNEYKKMEETNAYRRQELQQKLEVYRDEELMKVRKKIEAYLNEYNKDRKYSFIFSYVPNFMFYKDTLYDITGDLIKGLNASYKKADK